AVRTVRGYTAAVRAGPRVVRGVIAVSRVVRVVVRIEAAIAVVRGIVVASAPDRAAPRDHDAGVRGGRREHHRVAVVLDDGDVGDVVGWRADRNLINLARYRAGDLPRPVRAAPHEPHALKAHVVQVADLDDVLIGVHSAGDLGLLDRLELRIAGVSDL